MVLWYRLSVLTLFVIFITCYAVILFIFVFYKPLLFSQILVTSFWCDSVLIHPAIVLFVTRIYFFLNRFMSFEQRYTTVAFINWSMVKKNAFLSVIFACVLCIYTLLFFFAEIIVSFYRLMHFEHQYTTVVFILQLLR